MIAEIAELPNMDVVTRENTSRGRWTHSLLHKHSTSMKFRKQAKYMLQNMFTAEYEVLPSGNVLYA